MANTNTYISAEKQHSRHKDPRFQQLLALANDGDENAIADLFREFGYTFARSAQQ